MSGDGCLCLPASSDTTNKFVVLQAALLQHSSDNWKLINMRYVWTKCFERALGVRYDGLLTTDYCPGAWKLTDSKPAERQNSKSSVARIEEFLRYSKLNGIIFYIKNLNSIIGMAKLTEMKLTGSEALMLDPERKPGHGLPRGMYLDGSLKQIPDIPIHILDEECRRKKSGILEMGLHCKEAKQKLQEKPNQVI